MDKSGVMENEEKNNWRAGSDNNLYVCVWICGQEGMNTVLTCKYTLTWILRKMRIYRLFRHNTHSHRAHSTCPVFLRITAWQWFELRAEDSRISLSRSCQRQTLVPLFPPAKRLLQLLWLDNTWREPLRAWQRDKLTLFTCKTNRPTHLPQTT